MHVEKYVRVTLVVRGHVVRPVIPGLLPEHRLLPAAALTQPQQTHALPASEYSVLQFAEYSAPADGHVAGVLRAELQLGQAGSLHQGGQDVHKLHQALREHHLVRW